MRSRARLALLLLLSLTTAVAMACASSGAARPTAEPKPTADQTSPRETPDPTPAETEPTADPTLPKETPHPKPAEVKSPAVVAAPIESVAIEYRASPSEEAELVVVSGRQGFRSALRKTATSWATFNWRSAERRRVREGR